MCKQVTVTFFKMPFKTKHFNKNQKVWIQITTGAMAAKVAGKFSGKYRYVSAWVNWDKSDRERYPMPEFKRIDIDVSFAKRHNLSLC